MYIKLMHQKGFSHLGLILVILVVGIVAVLYLAIKTTSPTSSNTQMTAEESKSLASKMQIYTNEAWGYSFSYPKNFEVLLLAAGSGKQVAKNDSRQIAVYRNDDLENPVFSVAAFDVLELNPGKGDWTKSEVIINGNTFTKWVNQNSDVKYDIYYVQHRLDGLLEIYVAKNNPEANQILSTFEFVSINSAKKYVEYEYQVPSGWKEISSIPTKFLSVPSIVSKDGVDILFEGKMLSQQCNGPAFQNISDENQIIVMEIIQNKSDGDFCWSNGDFTDGEKWIGIGDQGSWEGDYLRMVIFPGSNDHIAVAALVNYETGKLLGQDALEQLSTTFKFK